MQAVSRLATVLILGYIDAAVRVFQGV